MIIVTFFQCVAAIGFFCYGLYLLYQAIFYDPSKNGLPTFKNPPKPPRPK